MLGSYFGLQPPCTDPSHPTNQKWHKELKIFLTIQLHMQNMVSISSHLCKHSPTKQQILAKLTY